MSRVCFSLELKFVFSCSCLELFSHSSKQQLFINSIYFSTQHFLLNQNTCFLKIRVTSPYVNYWISWSFMETLQQITSIFSQTCKMNKSSRYIHKKQLAAHGYDPFLQIKDFLGSHFFCLEFFSVTVCQIQTVSFFSQILEMQG